MRRRLFALIPFLWLATPAFADDKGKPPKPAPGKPAPGKKSDKPAEDKLPPACPNPGGEPDAPCTKYPVG